MKHACAATPKYLEQKGKMKNIGYIEKDARNNEELKEIL